MENSNRKGTRTTFGWGSAYNNNNYQVLARVTPSIVLPQIVLLILVFATECPFTFAYILVFVDLTLVSEIQELT